MGSVAFYVVLAFLAVLGLGMAAKPALMWKADHFFTVKEGEPTDFYMAVSRLGGISFWASALSYGLSAWSTESSVTYRTYHFTIKELMKCHR